MPRYYFHRTGGQPSPDMVGTELPDLSAARIEAVRYAGEMMRDRPDYVWSGESFRVEVTGRAGELLCTILVMAIDAPAVTLRPFTNDNDSSRE